MAKQPTNLQIETISRELKRAVIEVLDAWRESNPAPSWEDEQEWRRLNPSPRDLHDRAANEIRDGLNKSADDLLVRIKLGAVQPDALYDELKRALEVFNERRLAYLNLVKP